MLKSLQAVQKAAKVLYVLVQICFVLATVGAVCTGVGGATLSAVPFLGEKAAQLFLSQTETADAVLLGINLLAEAVILAGQATVLGFARKYLANELALGTPFSHQGAKELQRLGILALTVPLGTVALSSAITALAGINAAFEQEYRAWSGVALFLLALVFRYGADLETRE